MIELLEAKSGNKRQPGTWVKVLAHTPEPEFKPFWTAVVNCPECGRMLNATLHSIAANGQISPSLGHPDSYPPCAWHVNPRLMGWTPNEWPLPETAPLETCERCKKQAHSIGGWGTWSGGRGIICSECVHFVRILAISSSTDTHIAPTSESE